MYIGPDRRAKRSKNIVAALRHLMESIAERFGLLGLVLTDDEGLLVAASSPMVDPEELAACTPLVERRLMKPEVFGWPLTVWPVQTGSGQLTFCAIGEKRAVGAATLMANQGIRRILD